MFKFALIGTVSMVMLLVAGSFAYASGVGPASGGYGNALNVASHAGTMTTGGTTTTGGAVTMPGSSETIANHVARAIEMMSARATQIQATAQMQRATTMDPVDTGYGMQSGNMGSTTGMGTSSGSTGSGTLMGTSSSSTTHTGSSSMMGAGSGSRMGR